MKTFFVLCVAICLLFCTILASPTHRRNVLERITEAQESSYGFTVLASATIPAPVAGQSSVKYVLVNMTSLQYLNEQEVNRPIWWHMVQIYAAQPMTASHALLWIDGGSNTGALPSANPTYLALASNLKTTIAVVSQFPNQPLSFAGDRLASRVEDQIMAWGWKKFIESNATKPEYLGHIYMAKSAMQAISTVESVLRQQQIEKSFRKWVSFGASKRGWASWLAAAADSRISHVSVAVIDILNMRQNLQHMYDVSCNQFPPAFTDYLQEGFGTFFNTTYFDRMAEIIDPLEYERELEDKPKFIVSASRDEFFDVSSGEQYYHLLEGKKNIRYVPNTGHSLANSDALASLVAWYQLILARRTAPNMKWNIQRSNSTHTTISGFVRTDDDLPLASLKIFEAVNPINRDFRTYIPFATNYVATDVPVVRERRWTVTVAHPAAGFKAFFVEAAFNLASIGGGAFKTTTTTYVVPDTLPTC